MEGHKDGVVWETITRNRCISWHLVGDAPGHLRARGKGRGKGMMEGMALIGEEREAEWERLGGNDKSSYCIWEAS